MSTVAGPLASLWGLERRSPGTDPGITDVGALPFKTELLSLGGGPVLVTSGGVSVRLPEGHHDRESALTRLEDWAYALLSESYRQGARGRSAALLRAYYLARPLLPRLLQLWLRRRHARRAAARAFLQWPCDGLFVALAEAYLALRLELAEGPGLAVMRRWPNGYAAAAVLTHDVEGARGQERCRDLMALEREKGFRSCFNFVAARYSLDRRLMDDLRAAGFEIGVHGIKHDGKKFSDRRTFERRLKALARCRAEWQAAGFRSPATHRRWEWMPELPFDYDSSYPDTDPYEPMPGGCGSPWPFVIGSLIELPITLPQDHTAWEILRRDALSLWREKAAWLRRCGGLLTLIVHPDYLTRPERWREYETFLEDLRGLRDTWVALPREVATWWRGRAQRERASLRAEGSTRTLVFGEAPP